MPPVAYSYIRFSSKKQGKGSSLYRQTQDTIAGESPESWCGRNNVLLSETTYRDLGLSAYDGSNVKQGELRVFLDAIDAGRVHPGDYLLVERVDRITRQGIDEGMDLIKRILRRGISIVTLASGRVYGPDAVTGLMKGSLELQFYLEQAQQYSETLSRRVAAAWQHKRERARAGVLATAKMPPWLRAEGPREARRAVVIPEKVAVVLLIFEMAVAGLGIKRILRALLEAGTPPITSRLAWSRSGVRRILTNRAVLGEHQPTRKQGKVYVPDGEPIEGYYPAIIPLDLFHRAQACLTDRTIRKRCRDSKLLNVFAGLVKDARGGQSYITDHRLNRVSGEIRHGWVLRSAVKTGDSASFPFFTFEAALLACLREVDPRELLPEEGGADEARRLSAEVDALQADIDAMSASLGRKYSEALDAVLRRKEDRKKQVVAELAEARLRAADPVAEAWDEVKGLLGALDTAPDRTAALLRLRAVLRRIIDRIDLLVVPHGHVRLASVSVRFAESVGGWRFYWIAHRPPRSNGKARQEGGWYVESHRLGHPEIQKLNAELAAAEAEIEAAEAAAEAAGLPPDAFIEEPPAGPSVEDDLVQWYKGIPADAWRPLPE
jgi:DNA invertase Pin-like site-specific DNA recombinase